MASSLRAGFTLVELLLYLAISTIILGAAALILSVLLQTRIKAQTVAEVEQQGLAAMQAITQVVRNAVSTSAPAAAASGSTLSVVVVTGTKSPTVVDLSSGALRMTEGSGAATALTNGRVTASGLTVQNLTRAGTPGVVRVQFTLTSSAASGRNEYAYSETFIGSAALRQ